MVMVMNDLLPPPLCNVNRPSHSEIQLYEIWPRNSMVKVMCVVKGQGHVWSSKFKGQGYGQGQTHWSQLSPRVQSVCLLFVSWQSDHFWLSGDIGNSIFDLENSRSWSWPRSNRMVTFGALEFNRYVYFSFHGNRTIIGWDIANSIFDLENSRSRSWPRSNRMVTFEP